MEKCCIIYKYKNFFSSIPSFLDRTSAVGFRKLCVSQLSSIAFIIVFSGIMIAVFMMTIPFICAISTSSLTPKSPPTLNLCLLINERKQQRISSPHKTILRFHIRKSFEHQSPTFNV